jgi:hypothetical protein
MSEREELSMEPNKRLRRMEGYQLPRRPCSPDFWKKKANCSPDFRFQSGPYPRKCCGNLGEDYW